MTIFQIFTCAPVDSMAVGSASATSQLYDDRSQMYLLKKSFWTQHYNTQCYTGSHRVLLFAVGVPGTAVSPWPALHFLYS